MICHNDGPNTGAQREPGLGTIVTAALAVARWISKAYGFSSTWRHAKVPERR